jgi:hypothetical protein
MTREEFGEALLRFGAKLERWPQVERGAAERLLKSDPLAAKMLADFTGFERAVSAAVDPPPFGAAEIGKVLAALDHPKETWWLAPRFWIASAGVTALSFAAGFVLILAMAEASHDVPAEIIGLATGQADIGGLL